jgi:hypothetical protein
MVSVSRKGKVTAEVGEVEVHIGTIQKNAEADWEADCALCEGRYLYSTKSAAADSLEDHFVQTHTTATA